MALPMDEQRILEEMERMLAADDPRLAARLAAFGQPGVGAVLRTRRARAALSLLMLAVIAAAAAVIYLVSAFRIGTTPTVPTVRHGYQTSQASTRPADRTVPLPQPVRCVALIAPHTCAAWSGGTAQGAGVTLTPGGTGTRAAAGHQGTGTGHVTHPTAAKP